MTFNQARPHKGVSPQAGCRSAGANPLADRTDDAPLAFAPAMAPTVVPALVPTIEATSRRARLNRLKCSLALPLLAALAGCAVGNGQSCGAMTSQTDCAPNRHVVSSVPIDSWVKQDTASVDADVRQQDWQACGGTSEGRFAEPVMPSGTSAMVYLAAARIKVEGVYQCMLEKNYRYIGFCDSTVMADSIACAARRDP